MYDLKNPLKNVNTQEGCQLPNNACPDCNDRGYCEPQWVNSICVCDLGFSGPNCNSSESDLFTSNLLERRCNLGTVHSGCDLDTTSTHPTK